MDEVFGLEEQEILRRNEQRAFLQGDLNLQMGILKQKDRLRWLREGDVNKCFFHKVINKRRKYNEISRLLIDKKWEEEVSEVKQGVFNYFSNYFKSKRGPKPTLRADFCDKQVSVEDNQYLLLEFTEEEVKFAIDSCGSSKSPGLNGFNFEFIKENWDLFKEEFMLMFKEFHIHGKLVKGLNPSFLVLVPKRTM